MSLLLACDPLQHTSIYQRAREDSDDSDGEGGLGNVSRVIMRPPGHSGKAKRGHLCFDASFETGNLGRVDLINEFEYDLFIRPDTCCPKFRFWFNFTVDNCKMDQRVIFNIVNISKGKNLYADNMTPLVKSSSRSKWQRIPKKHVFYHRSLTHQGHYVLSFAFGFDKEDEIYQFALAPPYSYSKLQTFLNVLDKKSEHLEDGYKREIIGHSVQKRQLDLITVSAKQQASVKEKRRVVAIMARVHPGESPASFICQGVLEFLISSHAIARVLRDHITFKVVPMMNPDGVFLGNYRSSVMGFDLNRSWHLASQWAHPTLKAMIDTLTAIDRNKALQLDFVLDIHAHSSLRGSFIYGNTYEDVYRYERHIVFPKLLASNAEDYISGNTMFNSDLSKSGTARRHLCSILSDRVNCYSLEVSIFGYQLPGSEIVIPHTEDSCILLCLIMHRACQEERSLACLEFPILSVDMRCGRNIIRTFLEYYQMTGVISMELTIMLSSKLKKKRPKTHRSRSSLRNFLKQRPKTSRDHALVHFTDLNINYDSETDAEDANMYSFRNHLSPKRNFISDRMSEASNQIVKKPGNAGAERSHATRSSPPPATFSVAPPPSLSIIDFNSITRASIERATRKVKQIK